MKLKQYQVDAFTKQLFAGNPAAVVPLSAWLDDGLMQAIAAENNLSETAFFVPEGKTFALRWFTPTCEVDLCGHATLAAAHVIFSELGNVQKEVVFKTRSGELRVEKQEGRLVMDFPAIPPQRCENIGVMAQVLGQLPLEVWGADDYLLLLKDEASVRQCIPNLALLEQLDRRGVMITAKGDAVDFVSRFFAPKYGIPEDPVTGSAHCMLAPYWAEKLGKRSLDAKQLSKRGGDVFCEVKGDRVLLAGYAITFMVAEIANVSMACGNQEV